MERGGGISVRECRGNMAWYIRRMLYVKLAAGALAVVMGIACYLIFW